MVERQFDVKLKAIKNDGSIEFKLLMIELQKEGVMHRLT